MRWMRRWLLEDRRRPDRGRLPDRHRRRAAVHARPARCSSDFKGKSVFDLNAERERRAGRAGERRSGEARARTELLAEVRRADRPARADRAGRREDRGEVERGGGTVRKLVFTTEPGIMVPGPALHAREGRRGSAADRSWSGTTRRRRSARRAGRGPAQGGPARPGRRPARDGRDGPRRGEARAASAPTSKEAFLALHLDRPLLGQRVGDLLSVLAALAGRGPAADSPSSATGPPGRSPCTRRRSSRGSSR